MATETTTKGRIGRLQRLLARLNSNREELQHVEPSRARLEEVFNQLLQAADLQASHTAAKQEAFQRLLSTPEKRRHPATESQISRRDHLLHLSLEISRDGVADKPTRSLPPLVSGNFPR